MSEETLIEWTSSQGDESEATADVTVFADGRLRLGPRFGNGAVSWHALSPKEMSELRRFVLEEQAFDAIEDEQIEHAVRAADEARTQDSETASARVIAVPQRDARISVLRRTEAGRTHRVRCYDLFGTAQRYPKIPALQQLRAIEVRLVKIAEDYAARA